MLGFELGKYVQVGRETEVDCALAELYVRTLATERLVKDTAHADIFNSIYTRMNEVRSEFTAIRSVCKANAPHIEQPHVADLMHSELTLRSMRLHDTRTIGRIIPATFVE